MKKITYVSILILFFSVVAPVWSADYGQGANAFTDNFLKTYMGLEQNNRARQQLELQQQQMELQRQELELQQKIEQERLDHQRKVQEQQQNNTGKYVANPGTAKDISQNNGTAWNNYDDSMKIFYVYAFNNASTYITIGALKKKIDFNDKENKQIEKLVNSIYVKLEKKRKNRTFTMEEIELWGRAMLSLETDIRNEIMGKYRISGVTVGQITEGLDVLYKDFRNAKIIIPDGIYVVKKQMEGLSDEETEKILLYLRGGKSDHDILTIKNAEGKIVKRLSLP